ncbi:MAG: hypothetical protein AAF899_19285 [Pseudomonadota bacterium]
MVGKSKSKSDDKSVKNVDETELSQFMQGEMQKSREGVLYIFGKTKVDGKFGSLFLGSILDTSNSYMKGVGSLEGISALSTTATVGGIAKIPLSEGVKYAEKQGGAKYKFPKDQKGDETEAKTVWQKIWNAISETAKWLWDKLVGSVLADPGNYGKALQAIIKFVVSEVTTAAIPLSGIFDVVSGTASAIKAGITKLMAWVEGKSIAFIKGYPTAVMDAINTAMNRSIGAGLYKAVKGGVQIGVDSIAVGAGALVKAIATALELLYQVVQRIAEIELTKNFCYEASVHWKARATSGFTKDPESFGNWMKKYCNRVPALAAVAMNCGYCGSPAQYIAMFDAKGEVLNKSGYLAGVQTLARLKKFGADYLNDVGLQFYSDDPVVNGALKAAKSYGQFNHVKQLGAKDVAIGVLTG